VKKILVTAGTVYGPLDDNKLVGNRVRGVWATRFADHLARSRECEVTLLVADIQEAAIRDALHHLHVIAVSGRRNEPPPEEIAKNLTVVAHKGFWDYRERCVALAEEHEGAVMAAAVVNWIPEKPFPGKMPTVGVGDRMNVPFILAPRVIDRMKEANPRLALVGCKMTIGETEAGLINAAYKTLLGARCNLVVANDMKTGLKEKLFVYQDRSTQKFTLGAGVDLYGDAFHTALWQVLSDDHYRTEVRGQLSMANASATAMFDRVVEKYRGRFTKRLPDGEFVFGAVAVPYNGPNAKSHLRQEVLVSPREKGAAFDSRSAVLVVEVSSDHVVSTFGGKGTLNAPLLVRHLEKYPAAHAVLHLHERLPNVPTEAYAPPGTTRDSARAIPGPVYNIEGHGFIACLDANGEIWK
jgi:hypothetical protein